MNIVSHVDGLQSYMARHRLSASKAKSPRLILIVVAIVVLLSFLTLHTNRTINMISLKSKGGIEMDVITTGAVIKLLKVPDRHGKAADIALGFDDDNMYRSEQSPYFGALVGRTANRIADATFTLDGKTYKLAANNGPNNLHGGVYGFSRRQWTVNTAKSNLPHSVCLEYTSPDGEEGFPGTVHASVVYTLTDDNMLIIDMRAVTDAATPVSMVQHTYFNLGGEGQGDVLDHELHLPNAQYVTPVNDVQIPTGEFLSVKNTAFDFLQPHTIGERITDSILGDDEVTRGYDHNWVLFGLGKDAKDNVHKFKAVEESKLVATVKDYKSGRAMEVSTTAAGIQFYSGNFLNGTLAGKKGRLYPKHAGLCLETQCSFPNAINDDRFPDTVLRPGEEYRHIVQFKFYTLKE